MDIAKETETKRLINRVNNLINHIKFHYDQKPKSPEWGDDGNSRYDFSGYSKWLTTAIGQEWDNYNSFDWAILFPRLIYLEQIGETIKANIESENAIELVPQIASEQPLQQMLGDPSINIPSETRFAVEQYMVNMANLRKWHTLNKERIELPPRLCTEKAMRNFRIAIDNKLIERTDNGYKWIFKNGHKASLAEFLIITYCDSARDYIKRDVSRELNELFGVTRLDRAFQQTVDGVTPAVQEWKAYLKSLFL